MSNFQQDKESPLSSTRQAASDTDDQDLINTQNAIMAQNRQELGGVYGSGDISAMYDPILLDTDELNAKGIIYPMHPDQSSVDSFREIRTRLLQLFQGENKVTMISSVVPDGGASHTAINTAAAFAFDESKTALLIDCNLKNPTLHDRLYVEPDLGITDFLRQQAVAIDNIIYATGIPRLRLIPAGKSIEGAGEAFSSLRMRAFMDVIRRRYSDRYIFVDAPPITHSADARILSNLCDCVVLVVPYGRVSQTQLISAVQAVGEHKLAGVIFSR